LKKSAKAKGAAEADRWIAANVRSLDLAALRGALRSSKSDGSSLSDLAARLKVTTGSVLDGISALRAAGATIVQFGDEYVLSGTPVQVAETDALHRLRSDRSGSHRFGVISDTHFGSKYCRDDVVATLYDWFAAEGITRVYHAGNWIDGEARFNKFDLVPEAHGMQAQLDLFVARYPRHKGIETHYVAGDDHEGWYSQREGVDIGRMLETTARDAGRRDLKYLGYKEAFVTLEHARTGETSKLLVDHPGGGSAYADSYAAQKRIEAAQGGEKPGMWIFGHWHKLGYFCPRGVHVILAGCTKDLDPFGRKKGLRYDVGGLIVECRQDPQGGIGEVTPRLRYFFDRGYYNQQFNMSAPVRRVRAPHGRKAVAT
jgi:hypothetical protein